MLANLHAPEVGLPLLGGPRRPQRKPRASTSSRRLGSEAGAPLCPACAPPSPGAALLGTARSWRGIVALTHLAREGRMTITIGRRKLLAALGGAAAAWPFGVRAQQPDGMRRIGMLLALAEDDPEIRARLAAFRQGLEKRGWSEGHNVHIDYRFAPASAQVQVLAKELVALQPDVILAHSTPVTAALQRESRTIPIVFAAVTDPIGSGFVASLPRPGGNITGVAQYEASVTGKWLAMLKLVAPGLVRAGF